MAEKGKRACWTWQTHISPSWLVKLAKEGGLKGGDGVFLLGFFSKYCWFLLVFPILSTSADKKKKSVCSIYASDKKGFENGNRKESRKNQNGQWPMGGLSQWFVSAYHSQIAFGQHLNTRLSAIITKDGLSPIHYCALNRIGICSGQQDSGNVGQQV